MKKVKYPDFGKWLKKSRGSLSLQSVGRLIGKEHNTVSNYEKGYVRPPKLIVAHLINYFNGDPLEVAEFLRYDPVEIQELCISSTVFSGKATANFKDEYWQKLVCARKFREIESPDSALQMINACILSLETRINAELDPLKDIKDLRYLLLQTYGEKIRCLTLLLPREVVITKTYPIHSRMMSLSVNFGERFQKSYSSCSPPSSYKALECNAPIFSGLAYCDSCLAAAYFVAQDYKKAIDYQNRVIPLCGFDKNLLSETYRGLILSLAHLQEKEKVREQEKIIEGLLGKEINDPTEVDSLRCAIAEAKMLVGRDGSHQILSEIEDSILNAIKFLPLKRIQFYKTQLFIAVNDIRMNRKVDIDRTHEVITKGFSLAQFYKYRRHAKEITSLGRMIEHRESVRLGIDELSAEHCSA